MLMKRSLALFTLLALFSCERVDVPSAPEEDVVYHGMIELGERLEDPYSVDNITKAIENLYPTKAGRVNVDPTDLYLRFLPSSEEEYRLLESTVSAIADHPLDYRIVREGDYYHDPEIPDGDITWQYVVVPSDYKVPEGIRCERAYRQMLYIETRRVHARVRYRYRLAGRGEGGVPDYRERGPAAACYKGGCGASGRADYGGGPFAERGQALWRG